MKKLFALVAVLGLMTVSTVHAEVYGFDKAHTHVGFSVRHALAPVQGEFKDFDGTIKFDDKKPTASKIDVTIQTASINTDNDMRDKHLQSADFFDAEKYPTITFKSTKVEAAGDNQYKVTGDLTIHGVTKSVVLDADYLGKDNMMGMDIAGFTASTKIDRRDFGLAWGQDKLTAAGNLIVANDINIKLDISLMTKASLEKMKKMMSKPKEAPKEDAKN